MNIDFQEYINNAVAVARAERMKTSDQFTLGEMIMRLETIRNEDYPVIFDVVKFHPTGIDSWRGVYSELALEYSSEGEPMSAKQFLTILKETMSKTLVGYKGGDFLMGKTTPVWVANNSETYSFREGYTAVIDIVLSTSEIVILTRIMEDN